MTSQRDIEQFAAILTRYPIYEPKDTAEEWDIEFYNSRCNLPHLSFLPPFIPPRWHPIGIFISAFLSSFFSTLSWF